MADKLCLDVLAGALAKCKNDAYSKIRESGKGKEDNELAKENDRLNIYCRTTNRDRL